jgi:hypothetical protein
MTKRAKFRLSPTEGYYVVFGDNNWAEIESTEIYGRKIPKAARDLIGLATLYLTFWLPIEESAPSLDGATKARMIALQKLATQTRAELFPEPFSKSPYNLNRIDTIICELQSVREKDHFDVFRICLNALIEFQDLILHKIEDGRYGLWEGSTWDIWVVLITCVLRANKLPTGVGDPYVITSKGDNSPPAPFMKLIRYLSDFAIQGKTRIKTPGGLAQSIKRARRAIRTSDADVSKIKEHIYKLLGVPGYTDFDPSKFSEMQLLVHLVLNSRDAGAHPISEIASSYS